MKKVMFLLVVLFSITSAKSQTYEENVNRILTNICDFQKKLTETKNRIYYLEVTLNSEIYEDSVKGLSNKKYLFDKASDLKRLQREKFFAKDELVVLYDQKKMLESTIKDLKETLLNAEETFAKNEMSSKIPDRMTRFEYKQRSRAQAFKASEEKLDGKTISQKTYPGLLVNYKTGKNELARFSITRIGFPEFLPVEKVLNPGEEIGVELPAGNYQVEITCGYFKRVYTFFVNPLAIKHLNGQEVYWGCYKSMSDN